MPVSVRRSAERFLTEDSGIRTRHSFSFGHHYDPAQVGFGVITAINDENLPTEGGYADHPHAELVIVSVVLEGVLQHTSSVGSAELGPGSIQVLTAGTGVTHSERSVGGPARFLQTWIRPRRVGLEPAYACHLGTDLDQTGLVPLAGGDGPLILPADARLWRVHGAAELPKGGWYGVAVGPGTASWGANRMTANDGDAIRATGERVSLTGDWIVWSL